MSAQRKILTTLLPALAIATTCGPARSSSGAEPLLSSDAASPIVKAIREATGKYRDVNVAIADGYAGGDCVSGRDGGAMGIHFVNVGRLGDGRLELAHPEALIYEPLPGGKLRLVGVEYITFVDVWSAVNAGAPATLAGHLLHYSGAPNRYAIPAHYELHVWAWKHNPVGTFADWNPTVSCDAFLRP